MLKSIENILGKMIFQNFAEISKCTDLRTTPIEQYFLDLGLCTTPIEQYFLGFGLFDFYKNINRLGGCPQRCPGGQQSDKSHTGHCPFSFRGLFSRIFFGATPNPMSVGPNPPSVHGSIQLWIGSRAFLVFTLQHLSTLDQLKASFFSARKYSS